jgi:hypothetical protein
MAPGQFPVLLLSNFARAGIPTGRTRAATFGEFIHVDDGRERRPAFGLLLRRSAERLRA